MNVRFSWGCDPFLFFRKGGPALPLPLPHAPLFAVDPLPSSSPDGGPTAASQETNGSDKQALRRARFNVPSPTEDEQEPEDQNQLVYTPNGSIVGYTSKLLPKESVRMLHKVLMSVAPPPRGDVVERPYTAGGAPSPPPPGRPAYAQPPDAKCQLQWHLYPTATAPNRFGNHLQPPVEPPLGPPPRPLPLQCIPVCTPPPPGGDVVERPYTAGGAPPPPGPKDHRGKQRNLQLGPSYRAIFGTQTFETQAPPPPSLF